MVLRMAWRKFRSRYIYIWTFLVNGRLRQNLLASVAISVRHLERCPMLVANCLTLKAGCFTGTLPGNPGPTRHLCRLFSACFQDWAFGLRNPFPLTAFKNAPNPKFVPNLSQRLFFFGVPVRGSKICENLSEHYRFSNLQECLTTF